MVIRGERLVAARCSGEDLGKRLTVSTSPATALRDLAASNRFRTIAWYDERLEPWLSNPEDWPALLRHRLELLHIGCFQNTHLAAGSLARVEFDSPFLVPGPRDCRYPTWLISPAAGIADSEMLRRGALEPTLGSLAASLFDLGRRVLNQGLCAYSEPALLQASPPKELLEGLAPSLSDRERATLIGRSRRKHWVLFWFLGRLIYDRRLPVASLTRGLLASRPAPVDLGDLHPDPEAIEPAGTVDVVIPTLGRPEALAQTVEDLADQTALPQRVVIVDQRPEGSLPPAKFHLKTPFEIDYLPVEWVGACAARNLAISRCNADWILFLDDDVRLPPRAIDHLIRTALAYEVEGVNAAVHRDHEEPSTGPTHPWARFAAGACLVSSRACNRVAGFDVRLEGGYGEDYDYGMQLRLAGCNILYTSGQPILHLKAPSGGFRAEHPHPWSDNPLQPKPSPTVLLSRWKHHTAWMKEGYQLFYWLGRLRRSGLLKWPRELVRLRREWREAVRWCGRLARSG